MGSRMMMSRVASHAHDAEYEKRGGEGGKTIADLWQRRCEIYRFAFFKQV